jgi:hypothetical protein
MWGGFSRKVGDTLVVNVSSADDASSDPGNYALIDTADWSVVLLSRKDPLMTIRRSRVSTKRFNERAESIKWKKPKITGRVTLNPDEQAFVDVETGLARGNMPGKLWLIGLWYKEELRQFLFPAQRGEFIKYLKQNQINSLASWSQYDHKALAPLLAKARLKMEFKDALKRASKRVIWYTYSLHELYGALFGKKNDEPISGRHAGLYADHLIIPNLDCKYCPPRSQLIERIKERNRMDLVQMVAICKALC